MTLILYGPLGPPARQDLRARQALPAGLGGAGRRLGGGGGTHTHTPGVSERAGASAVPGGSGEGGGTHTPEQPGTAAAPGAPGAPGPPGAPGAHTIYLHGNARI